jgi:predicted DNA-binding WGR domain protein
MMITLYRTDSSGASHYYTLHDRQGHLFSDYSFTASWGRNLSAAREKVYQFGNQAEMDAKIRGILRSKLAQGYRVLYSYLHSGEMKDLRPVLKNYAAR